MLHQPAKPHPGSISHFLALHNATTLPSAPALPSLPLTPKPKSIASNITTSSSSSYTNDIDDSETKLDSISNIGKSFTIAAILGLKKKAAAAVAAAVIENNNQKDKEFNVMNLSMHNMHNTPNSVKGTAFHVYESTDNNRLLSNVMTNTRMPMSFVPHHFNHHHPHLQQQQAQQQQQQASQLRPNIPNHPHHRTNGTPASALQSLQQQFHQQHNAMSFGSKEHRGKNGMKLLSISHLIYTGFFNQKIIFFC